MDGWWGQSFSSSGTAAGCLSWEVWWLRTGSTGLAILLPARSLLQIVVRGVITSSPPAGTSSAGMLSTPPDLPFLNNCTEASTSLQRMALCVRLGIVQYWWISTGHVTGNHKAERQESIKLCAPKTGKKHQKLLLLDCACGRHSRPSVYLLWKQTA